MCGLPAADLSWSRSSGAAACQFLWQNRFSEDRGKDKRLEKRQSHRRACHVAGAEIGRPAKVVGVCHRNKRYVVFRNLQDER